MLLNFNLFTSSRIAAYGSLVLLLLTNEGFLPPSFCFFLLISVIQIRRVEFTIKAH